MSMDLSKILENPGTEDKIRVRQVYRMHGIALWSVRGEVVRDDLDVDFVGGGHHHRHDYIPEGEIWVERAMSRKDFALTAAHEMSELCLIRRGWDHEKAHEAAARIERNLRHARGRDCTQG